MVLEANPGFVAGNRVQIDDGLSAEFHQVQPGAAAANTLAVRLPLDFAHAGNADVQHVTLADAIPAAQHGSTLSAATAAGATTLQVAAIAGFNPPIAARRHFPRRGACG